MRLNEIGSFIKEVFKKCWHVKIYFFLSQRNDKNKKKLKNHDFYQKSRWPPTGSLQHRNTLTN